MNLQIALRAGWLTQQLADAVELLVVDLYAVQPVSVGNIIQQLGCLLERLLYVLVAFIPQTVSGTMVLT